MATGNFVSQHSSKSLVLCSAEERNSYRFDDTMFIFAFNKVQENELWRRNTDESFEMYLLHLFENSYFFKLAFHSTHISYQCLCYCTSCRQGFLLMNQTNTHLDWSAVKVKETPPPQGNHRFWQSSRSHVWCAQVCEVQSGVTPESGHWKCWWTMTSLYSDQIMAVMFTVGLESDTDFHLIAVRLEIYIYSYVCQSQSLNLRCKLHCILSVSSTSIFNLVNSFEFYIFYI